MLPLKYAHTAQTSSIGNIRLLQAWQEIWQGLRFSYAYKFLDKPSGKAERVLAQMNGNKNGTNFI